MRQERRRYLRWHASVPVKLDVIGKVGSYRGSLSKDISAGGIQIVTDKFLPRGTNVRLELFLDRVKRVFQAKGKLVWIEQLPYRDDAFKMGLEFVEIDPRSREELLRLADYYVRRN